ncbi:MAG: hypothetical protein ABJF88_16175 [Rhodothermales bacterium]
MPRGLALLTVLALGLLAACAPTNQVGTVAPEKLDRAIDRARADLVRRPNDAGALRDLGALLAQAERFDDAAQYLRQAYVEDRDDPKTLYYLGLLNEAEGDPGEALQFYGRFEDISPRSAFRPLLKGRYESLVREQIEQEMGSLAAREDSLATAEASPQTVAVFPFAYRGSDLRYAPLGRGLGEMVQADLAGIGGLQVVERLRLQSLLDELSLSQSEAFNPATTPRVGRLLRAGRAVGGSFDVEDRDLRIDAALWNWAVQPTPNLQSRSDNLNDLFQLKREVVLALVEQMGVPLTAEERAMFDAVPTRNLQAFLLYSRGLEEEDAGNFAAATGLFREAVKLDPSFERAADASARADAVDKAGGSIQNGLAAARSLENFGGIDLVGSRLGKLNDSIGSAFIPGTGGGRDDPSGEAAAATSTFEPLPLPPSPPPPGGN